jgi:hypothetical protein
MTNLGTHIEKIRHAAVRAENCTMIFLGKCHADCFEQAYHIGWKLSSRADHQGFMTSRGRFVNRRDAAKIAFETGQVKHKIDILFSEDLWSPQDGGRFLYDSVRGYI